MSILTNAHTVRKARQVLQLKVTYCLILLHLGGHLGGAIETPLTDEHNTSLKHVKNSHRLWHCCHLNFFVQENGATNIIRQARKNTFNSAEQPRVPLA